MGQPLPARLLDTALDRSIALGYSRVGLAVRRHLPGWPADPEPGSLRGQHVAVTGATSGLGIATAAGLADLGATVHLVVRNEDKARDVVAALRRDRADARFEIHRCDVGDLDDVRRFAAGFREAVPDLDALVHNAGVMPPERTESPQGHELSMAVHVLGPVLMTDLLRPALRQGRVVLVTSGGMYAQPLPVDDPEFLTGDYTPTAAYARSKRMQVELAPALDERWSGDRNTLSTTHPGWADTPGVAESLPGFRRLTRPLLRDGAGGADTSVWLAATPGLPSGQLWHDRAIRPTSLVRRTRPTAEQRQRAWQWCQDAIATP
ncbi:SDR family NAD(P)-dependent oxidoreductase [Nocardioides sp.]|uniref:SDR family NAD(P)-dependent oxidoreductase n=1 Tax=Nocardioides sp. TaxID=35761 RepID=UPI0027374BF9|nr:SDR family NAD(P)-dependent oxidoreductase [Nocardioides sp.]MDP3895015.1 SDR family NAD(P)-dependent oxidoreductase [Nocardioides sp.]